jgi:hypothetical protein
MYMYRLRHINDSVLLSLKMEGIHLLFFFCCVTLSFVFCLSLPKFSILFLKKKSIEQESCALNGIQVFKKVSHSKDHSARNCHKRT